MDSRVQLIAGRSSRLALVDGHLCGVLLGGIDTLKFSQYIRVFRFVLKSNGNMIPRVMHAAQRCLSVSLKWVAIGHFILQFSSVGKDAIRVAPQVASCAM